MEKNKQVDQQLFNLYFYLNTLYKFEGIITCSFPNLKSISMEKI